MTDAKPNAVVM